LVIKSASISYTNFVGSISYCRTDGAKYDKIIFGLHAEYPLFLSDFKEKWTFFTDFRKYLNFTLHNNPLSGSWVNPCGETDRHGEAKSSFSQLC
jgi:hypothetical protein